MKCVSGWSKSACVTSVAGLPAKGVIVGTDLLPRGVRAILRVTDGILYADLVTPGFQILVR